MIPALKRGLEVLKLVLMSDSPLGYNDILARTRIPSSSVARLLKSLEEGRYIVKDENGKYRAGNELLMLGHASPAFTRLLERSKPVLRELSELTGNTAVMIYWNGKEMQCIAKVIDAFSISMQDVGNISTDCSTTPWGALFYLSLPGAARVEAQSGMERKKDFISSLGAQERYIEKNGFLFEDRVMYPHIRRFAAPVYEHDRIVGAVGLGGNTLTISDAHIAHCGKRVRSAAEELSLVQKSGKKDVS